MMLRAGLVALLSFCLIAYLAGSLASMAVDPEKMLQKMNQYADTSASDVSEDEYPALAFALTDYLKGKAEEAQISIIMGVDNADFERAIKVIYEGFVRDEMVTSPHAR